MNERKLIYSNWPQSIVHERNVRPWEKKGTGSCLSGLWQIVTTLGACTLCLEPVKYSRSVLNIHSFHLLISLMLKKQMLGEVKALVKDHKLVGKETGFASQKNRQR